MKPKDATISFDDYHPAVMPMAFRVDAVYRKTLGYEAVVTSGSEVIRKNGKLVHSERSRHYAQNFADGLSRAMDFRTWTNVSSGRQLSGTRRAALVAKVAQAAGDQFRVIDEGHHIHIQFQG